jgi:hypothetical protein
MKIESIVSVFIGLLVSVGGVGIAYLWHSRQWVLSAVIILVTALLGWLFRFLAEDQLPARPRTAIVLLELWILFPAAFAMFLAAALVWAGVWLAPHLSDSDFKKESLKTLSGAIAGFLAAFLLKSFEDADGNFLAVHAKKIFQKHYRRKGKDIPEQPQSVVLYFEPESPGERLVNSESYDGISGWGFAARHERARKLAAVLPSAAATATPQATGRP